MRNPEFPVVLYAYEDPREPGHPRYVGQSQDPMTRNRRHIRAAVRMAPGRVQPVTTWISQLLKEGVRPRFRFLASVPYSEADKTERQWIADFRQQGFQLLNQHDGGLVGTTYSPELCKRMSDARKGQKRPSQVCEKISTALSGREKTPEHVAAMKAGWANRRAQRIPEARPMMEAILSARDRGESFSVITRNLNASSFKPPRGGQWSVSSVHNFFQRHKEFYGNACSR